MDTKDLIIIGLLVAGVRALNPLLGSHSGGRVKRTAGRTFPHGLRDALLSLLLLMPGPAAGEPAKERSLSAESVARLMKEMVWVEGGSFTMGSDSEAASSLEKPSHRVTLSGFHIGKYEVSQELFEEVMGWNVSYFPGKGHAVNNVSWWNIQLFLQRLNKMTGREFRLPTEAEWEYAAKGGQKSKGHAFSGSGRIGEVAWYGENSERRPHPSGTKQPNELGLHDMTGNLWEYCHDDALTKPYPDGDRTDPLEGRFEGPHSKQMKIMRGGGYESDEDESFVYRRDAATPNLRLPDIGFRLVMVGKEK